MAKNKRFHLGHKWGFAISQKNLGLGVSTHFFWVVIFYRTLKRRKNVRGVPGTETPKLLNLTGDPKTLEGEAASPPELEVGEWRW